MDRGGVRNSRKRTSPRSREKLSARATETGLSSHMGWDTLPLTGTRVLRSGFPLSPDPGAGLLTRRCELSLWACLRPPSNRNKTGQSYLQSKTHIQHVGIYRKPK